MNTETILVVAAASLLIAVVGVLVYWWAGLRKSAQQILDDARSLIGDHEGQTLASVQVLAPRYLDPERALTVLVRERRHR